MAKILVVVPETGPAEVFIGESVCRQEQEKIGMKFVFGTCIADDVSLISKRHYPTHIRQSEKESLNQTIVVNALTNFILKGESK